MKLIIQNMLYFLKTVKATRPAKKHVIVIVLRHWLGTLTKSEHLYIQKATVNFVLLEALKHAQPFYIWMMAFVVPVSQRMVIPRPIGR